MLDGAIRDRPGVRNPSQELTMMLLLASSQTVDVP
jgi:hypothetical protein